MQKVRHFFLGHIRITERHTGKNIKTLILRLLRSFRYSIKGEEVNLTHYLYSSTTDNANNVKNANVQMGLVGIGCMAHKINLAMKKAIGGKIPRSRHPKDPRSVWPEEND